jgi:O-antigen biosynthesis protein WbqP
MKRTFDIIFSLFCLIILIIPIIIISIFIKTLTPGKVIYWSERVGIKNKLFLMPKFRTMKEDAPEIATDKLKNPNDYITKLGKFLRKTSLDELPQIWNILKGDMSFVGPRPALYNQYDLIKMRTNRGIHNLKPGLTGWAQINGRDNLSNEMKVNYDFEYLIKRNLFFDLKIIFLTFYKVFKQDQIL